MEPMGYPEMSIRNYHYTLRKIPKERRSHLYRGRSLKSRNPMKIQVVAFTYARIPATRITHSKLLQDRLAERVPSTLISDTHFNTQK
jgi:hypothetical protein